jgi:hypothetical protein
MIDMCDSFLSLSFDDPGPHGVGRYNEHMLPEIVKRDWRKGAQVTNFICPISFALSLFSDFS